jgi:hypothetical protein
MVRPVWNTSGTVEQVLVEKWIQGDGYVDGWTLTKLVDNSLRLAIDDGSGVEIDLDSIVPVVGSEIWYHIAATRQAQQAPYT